MSTPPYPKSTSGGFGGSMIPPIAAPTLAAAIIVNIIFPQAIPAAGCPSVVKATATTTATIAPII